MTPGELAAKCRLQQDVQGRLDAEVVLRLPGRLKGKRRRLTRNGPYGRIVGVTRQGEVVVLFRADEVLAWLTSQDSNLE